jgi:hypothetical protein
VTLAIALLQAVGPVKRPPLITSAYVILEICELLPCGNLSARDPGEGNAMTRRTLKQVGNLQAALVRK